MKILTEQGFKSFDGILSRGIPQTLIRIDFYCGECICCTPEHLIMDAYGEYIEAGFLESDEYVYGGKQIKSITEIDPEPVYDFLNVEDTHSYVSNGIVSHNCLYLDEFAFVPTNLADEFFTSVYPTISSGETTKIIITSTPCGMNHFYKRWTEAVEGINGFTPISVHWSDVPGRTQKWADEQRAALGEQQYLQEVEVEFMGSVGTLISARALKSLAFVKPIHLSDNGIKIYENPVKGHNYGAVVDTSRGKGLDYHAISLIDCTEIPYKLVATFRDNEMSPMVYPAVIKKMCDYYNQAYVLGEINDNGQQVIDILFDEYDYENILSTVEIQKKISVTWGYGNKSFRGIRTTKSVKRLGCSILKNLIEDQKLLITDFDTIAELSTFISKNNSFEAEEGSNDDTVMCLVLFAWLTNQQFFSELTNVNMTEKLYRDRMQQIEDESLPSPIFIDGSSDPRLDGYVEDGVIWNVVDNS